MKSTASGAANPLGYGTMAAAVTMLCAAAAFFLAHGFTTGWNLTSEGWDSNYYYRIATIGYGRPFDHALAFLPGYPILLIPAARLLAGWPFLASFLTSTALSTVSGALLFRLLRRHLETAVSLCGIMLLAFSPFSIYFYNGYSESAFLLCAVLTLLWLGNGRVLPAAAATGYAFLCRPYAIALVPLFIPLAWRLVRARDFWTLGWIVTLGAGPGIVYAGWMYHAFGDPFIAFKMLAEWKHYAPISSAWPWPIHAMYGVYFAFRNAAPGSAALSLIACIASIVAVLAAAPHLPRRLVAYSLLLLALVVLGDALDPVNLGRHSLLALAAFPALAVLLLGRDEGLQRWAKVARHGAFAITLLFFGVLFIVMTMRFSQGLWVS